MSTLNPTAFSIFADNPKDYEPGSAGEELAGLIDEDAYDERDFIADTAGLYDTEEFEQEDVVLDDGRSDENDYSHGEGEPAAVEPAAAPVASEELEEYEVGDPT